MTDNRTTELLDGLRNVGNLHEFAELFGFDWRDESDWTWHDVAVKMADELEQAIAATLGSDAKLCYATDYTHGRCKYSVNRGWTEDTKFYIPTLRHGTLTAEKVRELIAPHLHASPTFDFRRHGAVWSADFQAIADELNAELGSDEPPYDVLLRCLEHDWNISASWDGLRKFWCIELTDEGVRMRDATHGTLTADDIRDLIERHSDASGGNGRDFRNGAYKAIADELNAHVGRTCKLEPLSALDVTLNMLDQTEWGACSECGCAVPMDARFCNECGKAVSE